MFTRAGSTQPPTKVAVKLPPRWPTVGELKVTSPGLVLSSRYGAVPPYTKNVPTRVGPQPTPATDVQVTVDVSGLTLNAVGEPASSPPPPHPVSSDPVAMSAAADIDERDFIGNTQLAIRLPLTGDVEREKALCRWLMLSNRDRKSVV